jgi:flavorubredoxin
VASTTEIASDVFRISVFVPEINLEFSHFLVRDDEPLLFHAGLRGMFPVLREEISRLVDITKIRHIGFSHFESDECGALNQWLELAPSAQPVCRLVCALVSVNDFSIRPARALTRDDVLPTGRYRFRFIPTPHVPQGWDAGVLFEESERTLFCSDLFHQWGHQAPTTSNSIIERCKSALEEAEAGPFGELRAIHAPHRPGTRIISRAQAKNPGNDARLNLLRRWSTSTAGSRNRNARARS